ncbi:tubulin domain-containing protein [Emericellopsis atlantica]|uniref:Tubulin domain-containing protein n=1 Tax=Emericellopsis atlantica TaxID=2614577 RepID=A0A9P7ZP19_9HYPO|nr:tubulin domain-containing protein [Emericellopsis atlantica]KAG9255216.1 tubulin domain-containing protein [Emericellopsis atlantica]
MKEIITLQLGNLSNYAATHFWNAQESYFTYSGQDESPIDHNVHWRPGVGADGSETFLPRTVIYDLKGGFGSLRKINALYEAGSASDHAASSLWSGQSVVQKQQPIEQSEYQKNLDAGADTSQLTQNKVRYWSDFSRIYYHPKSLVQLYDYELNSSIRPFERYAAGTELFDSLDKEHDIVDRDMRPFVEECDRMQGIQALATLDDAWGGFSTKYLEALRDEYPKTCIWLWGLQSPMLDTPREKRQLRMSNVAQTLASTCASASMVVPLSIPESGLPQGVHIDPRSPWSTGAAFATAIETATMESRLTGRNDAAQNSLWDIVETLNAGGNQNMAKLRMRVASSVADLEKSDSDMDMFGVGQLCKGMSSTQKTGRSRVFGQLSTHRGAAPDEDVVKGEDEDPRARRLVGDPVYRRFDTPLKFPMLDSFPGIWPGAGKETAVDVQTVLSTETSIGPPIKTLKSLSAWSIPLDERETVANGLSEIADAYQDDWSSGSDEDDDDA